MAMTHYPISPAIPLNNPYEYNTVDVPIGGKLFSVKQSYDFAEIMTFADGEFKKIAKERLAKLMAEKLLESNFVEFTTNEDPITGRRNVYARCYLAPNDQVNVLRMQYVGPKP